MTKDGFLFPEEPSDPEVVTLAVPSSSHVFAETVEEDPEWEKEAFEAVQAIYRLEGAANDQGKALDQERDKRFRTTRTLKNSEADLAKAREDLKAKVIAAEEAQREAEWAKGKAQRAKVEADFGREEALAAKEKAETAAYAEGVAEIKALYKAQVSGAALDGAKAGEVVEEVGAAELREDPSEEAPQEVAEVPSDAQIPTTEEAAIPAVPLQAVPLGQGLEDPEVAPVQPKQKE
nr:neurofilament medium polypeptide-like [Quercus suber]